MIQIDILDRLRTLRSRYLGATLIDPVLADAIREIEHLRAAVQAARSGIDATTEFAAGVELGAAVAGAMILEEDC